jgi:hypothetical protein
MRSLLPKLILVAGLSILHAAGASYNFDVLYTGGGTASLVPGSDNPNTTNLQPGDDFLWQISADGNSFWNVTAAVSAFPLMGFGVSPSADRIGDFSLELRNNGATVFSTSETASVTSYVHIGTNAISLPSGLMFDQMILNYTLTSSTYMNQSDPLDPLNGTAADSNLSGPLPIFGAPEETNSAIEYVSGVPEPGTYALLGAGMIAIGAMRFRRSSRQ